MRPKASFYALRAGNQAQGGLNCREGVLHIKNIIINTSVPARTADALARAQASLPPSPHLARALPASPISDSAAGRA